MTWRTAAVGYTCIESDALDVTAHIDVPLADCSSFLQGEHKSFCNDYKTSAMSGGYVVYDSNYLVKKRNVHFCFLTMMK